MKQIADCLPDIPLRSKAYSGFSFMGLSSYQLSPQNLFSSGHSVPVGFQAFIINSQEQLYIFAISIFSLLLPTHKQKQENPTQNIPICWCLKVIGLENGAACILLLVILFLKRFFLHFVWLYNLDQYDLLTPS